jgi:transaldolase
MEGNKKKDISMKIYLDTLDIDMIRKHRYLISGITTNPTIAKRYGFRDTMEIIDKVRKIMDSGEIHVEVLGVNKSDIINQVSVNNEKIKDSEIIYKIPFSEGAIDACAYLRNNGNKSKINIHLVYSLNQALLAASVGVTYICPLVGRLDDIGHDAFDNIREINNAFKKNNEITKIMISSVRHPKHVMDAYKQGVDAITIPPNILERMFKHPLTEDGTKRFEYDNSLLNMNGSK